MTEREREREMWELMIFIFFGKIHHLPLRFHEMIFLPWGLINVNSDRARVWVYGDKIKIKYWRKKLIPKMFINVRKNSWFIKKKLIDKENIV